MKCSRIAYHGFTLLEMIAAIVVMSVISVTLMPVIAGASDSYASARDVRNSTERAAFALDRITRIAREAPIGDGDVGVGITIATPSKVVFSNGTGVQLSGTTLEMLVPGGNPVPLCFDVDSFVIQYFGEDGVSDMILTPAQSHRLAFTMTTANVEMSVLAYPRVWIGQ